MRVLYEDRSVNQIPFKENVSALELYVDNDENPSEKNITEANLVYSTDRGALGILHIPRVNVTASTSSSEVEGKNSEEDATKGASSKEHVAKKGDEETENKGGENDAAYEDRAVAVRRGWQVSGRQKGGKRSAAVNCLSSCDLTGDGVADILVGRNDGLIEVFGFDRDTEQPSSQFSTATGESICGIDYGEVSAAGYKEIVASTFSGRIISLTTESLAEKESTDKYGRSKGQVRREVQVNDMKKDIESLKKQLNDEAKALAKAFGKIEKKNKKIRRKRKGCCFRHGILSVYIFI